MNQQLIDSLFQAIQALSLEEQSIIAEKLAATVPEPTSQELAEISQGGGAFDFLNSEPDFFTLEDGKQLS